MKIRASSGLTLLEVLVALAIIGATFGVLAVTQVSNLQISAAARNESRATAEANAILEAVVRCVVKSHTSFANAAAGTGCEEAFPDGAKVEYGVLGEKFEEVGVIRVKVTVEEPSRVVFSRVVSCIDVQPPPAIAKSAPCPPPPPPPPSPPDTPPDTLGAL